MYILTDFTFMMYIATQPPYERVRGIFFMYYEFNFFVVFLKFLGSNDLIKNIPYQIRYLEKSSHTIF